MRRNQREVCNRIRDEGNQRSRPPLIARVWSFFGVERRARDYGELADEISEEFSERSVSLVAFPGCSEVQEETAD